MHTQLIKALESGVKKQNQRIRKLMLGAVAMIVVGVIIDYLSVAVISPRGADFAANILFLIGAFLIILGVSILFMWPIAQIKTKIQMKKAEAITQKIPVSNDENEEK